MQFGVVTLNHSKLISKLTGVIKEKQEAQRQTNKEYIYKGSLSVT